MAWGWIGSPLIRRTNRLKFERHDQTIVARLQKLCWQPVYLFSLDCLKGHNSKQGGVVQVNNYNIQTGGWFALVSLQHPGSQDVIVVAEDLWLSLSVKSCICIFSCLSSYYRGQKKDCTVNQMNSLKPQSLSCVRTTSVPSNQALVISSQAASIDGIWEIMAQFHRQSL